MCQVPSTHRIVGTLRSSAICLGPFLRCDLADFGKINEGYLKSISCLFIGKRLIATVHVIAPTACVLLNSIPTYTSIEMVMVLQPTYDALFIMPSCTDSSICMHLMHTHPAIK